MEEKVVNDKLFKRLTVVGWVISIIGTVLYIYGYFTTGGPSFINWPLYLPGWAASFVPNWEAEAGFALSIIGSIPIYYVEFARR